MVGGVPIGGPDLDATLGAPTGYDRTGHLQLYEDIHEGPAAETRARTQNALGIPSEHLDRDGLLEREPGLGPHVRGAVHCPLDGVADHRATTLAYASAAERAGVTIREGCRVVRLASERSATDVTLESGEVLPEWRTVVLLANGGTGELLSATWGRTLPVWNVLPQAMFTTPAPEPPFRSLIGHAHRKISLKMIPTGQVMISGGWRGRWSEDGSRRETIPSHVEGNWNEAIRAFPAIGDLDLSEATADRVESMSVDGIPIIDRIPENPNVFVGAGWTGHGWAIAPAVAAAMADWILDGGRPPVLAPFALERFG